MEVREAEFEELESVVECLQVLNINGVDFFDGETIREIVLNNDGIATIAKEGEEVVGASIVLPNVFNEPFTCQLFALGCKRQGIGVGKALVKNFEQYAKYFGYNLLTLESYEFYNARGFYEKLGYTLTKTEDDEIAKVLTFQKSI